MYSFYGGRPGNSFVISRTYTSKEEMLRDFANGDQCQVYYDEYVLINDTNKASQQHGNIYRRAYGTGELSAVLVGNIAGPPGPAPTIELKEQLVNNLQDIKQGKVKVIPGKDEFNNYNDYIKWRTGTEKNETEDEATTYFEFQVPYPVIDFTAKVINPQVTDITSKVNIKRIDDKKHPFYQQYQIDIPRGVPGNSISDLTFKKQNNKDYLSYYSDKIILNEETQKIERTTGTVNVQMPVYVSNIVDDTASNQIIVTFNDNRDPVTISKNFSLTNIGISNLNFDNDVLSWSENDNLQTHTLNYVKSIRMIDNDLTATYADGTVDGVNVPIVQNLVFPVSIDDLIADNNIFRVNWSNNSHHDFQLPNNITDVKIENNFLYTKSNKQKEWVRKSSIQSIQEQLGNINWIGIGKLTQAPNSSFLTIEFLMPLNNGININQTASFSAGSLTVYSNSSSITLDLINTKNAIIEQNPAGLYIKCDISYNEDSFNLDELNDPAFVNIEITNMNLKLTTMQSEAEQNEDTSVEESSNVEEYAETNPDEAGSSEETSNDGQ